VVMDLKRSMDTKIIYFFHFSKTVYFSDNYDSNIGRQHFVNMKKFNFEIVDVQKCWRKRDAMLTC